MHQEIIDYIGQAQKHGLTDFEIKQNLLSAGWEATSVEESFVFAKAAESRPQAFSTMETTAKNPGNPSSGPQMVVKPTIQPAGVSNPNANITISEKHFAPGSNSGFKKSTIIVLAVLLILSLGGVAFGYYQYIYTTPEKVLAKFFAGYASSKTETVKTNVTLSYSDNTAPEDGEPPQEYTLGLNVDGYFDNRDANNIKADANVKLSLKNHGYGDGYEGSLQLQYMNFAKVYFINLANIPQIKGMFGDKDVSWIKFDLEELEKYAKEQSPANASSTEKLLNNDELKKKLNDLWNNAKILNPGKVLAKEALDGTAVYRLEPEVDYTKLEKAVLDSIDIIQSFQAESDLKLSDQQRSAISVLIKKFKVKEFKIWVGQKDYKLYKIKLIFAAPNLNDFTDSIISDIEPTLNSTKVTKRDTQRLYDVRRLASALELYKNDLGGYPKGIEGSPFEIVPKYIEQIPIAPIPVDGTCTNYYNSYWYSPEGNPTEKNGMAIYPSYSMTFCLGVKTSNYASGIAKINPKGVYYAIACPSTPENCAENPVVDIVANFEKMRFEANILLEVTFKDYGMVKEILEPINALDFIELFKEALGKFDNGIVEENFSDEKRVTDTRYLKTALENYFLSEGKYPESLDRLVPEYIVAIPTAPTPAGGLCTEQENVYSYKLDTPTNFRLDFCLGSTAGGYSAGNYFWSKAGISPK
ncbi:MAG: hypothetical protein WC794_00990 [Candidatus Doudnabacteria bacterium]|jgi:hypothetical protein